MNIAEFRSLVAEQLKLDQRIERHNMTGPDLDELLTEAAQEMAIPVSQLDYEVEEYGNRGLLRLLKPRNYKITVYRSEVDRRQGKESFVADMIAQRELFAPMDGKMFIQVRSTGIYLKLRAPKNDGEPVREEDILLQVNRYLGRKPKRPLIHKLCQQQECDYTKISEIAHRSKADTRVTVQISPDRMQASILLTPPEDYGAHLQSHELQAILKEHGVSYGYNEPYLEELCDEPIYNQALMVAEGTPATDGTDLYIELSTLDKNDHFEEENGKAQLRSKRNWMVVTKGSMLGVLHQPSRGQKGRNVLGQVLPTIPGNDRPYNIGSGCRYDTKTHEIIADSSGEVIFDEQAQSIKVQEIFVVEGNLQNDIDFPGSVLIKGDVENGYNLKAEANITIEGHLGRSQVKCGGQLVIKAGINAVDSFNDVIVHAKGNIYTKYINNVGISSGKSIIVEYGILSSTVLASEYVICSGKNGVISASVINSGVGIYAKRFGSANGMATELTVAMPKKLEEEQDSLQQKYATYRDKIKPLKQGITVQNRRKEIMSQSGTINTEMQEQIDQKMTVLQTEIEQIETILQAITTRLRELESETENLSKEAFITNEKQLHPGVVLTIGNHHMDIQTTYAKGLTFRLKNAEIHPAPMEEFDTAQFELE